MASSQYDAIGEKYDQMTASPASWVMDHTLSAYIPMIQGKKVLDLACGTGRWSRWLQANGAVSVVGVDLSPIMIEGARKASVAAAATAAVTTNHNPITYLVADCSKPLVDGQGQPVYEHAFDVVFAAWLLNYAPDAATMAGMWQNITQCLKQGGSFIGIVPNLSHGFQIPMDPKYGVTIEKLEDVNVGRDDHGARCRLTAHTQPMVQFENYELNRGIYVSTATEAGGMEDVAFQQPVTPPLSKGQPEDFWDAYSRVPLFEVMTARKKVEQTS